MSTIGMNISRIRRDLGLTQEELAKKMGYKSKSTINKIELGINDIPQSKIAKFAEVLGTTPAHLMGWEDLPTINLQLMAEPSTDKMELNDGEKALLDLFNRVPKDKQQLVLQMIRAALGSQE